MDEAARFGCELRGDFAEARAIHMRGDFDGAHFEMYAEAMLDEVVLLPFVERGVEGRLERRLVVGEVCAGVQERELREGEFVEPTALGPRCGAECEEVGVAHVLHDHDALGCVVEEDFRHAHADAREEARDFGVASVIGAIERVADEDARATSVADAPEFAARAALLDGLDGGGHCVGL